MWLLLAVVGARCRAQLTLLNVVVPSVVMMLSAVAASVVVVDFGALWWCDRPRWPVPLQVYLDDMMSGFNVSSNTFFNVSRAFLLGGDTMWHTHSSRSLSFFSWHVTVTVNKTITKEDHFRDLPDTARRDSRGNSPHASPDWFENNRLVVSSGLFQVAVRTFLRTTRSTAAISAKATGRRGSGLAPFPLALWTCQLKRSQCLLMCVAGLCSGGSCTGSGIHFDDRGLGWDAKGCAPGGCAARPPRLLPASMRPH